MTPKEKAKELIDKYLDINNNIENWKIDINIDYELAKQCALISVDEILKNNIILFEDVLNDQYWKNIKQEIEKL